MADPTSTHPFQPIAGEPGQIVPPSGATPFPRWSSATTAAASGHHTVPRALADDAAFLPRPNESVAQYAERLRTTHQRLTMLLAAVERGLRTRPPDAPALTTPPAVPRIVSLPSTRSSAFVPGPGVRAGSGASAVRPPRPPAPGRTGGTVGLTAAHALAAEGNGTPPAERRAKVERRVGPPTRRTGSPDTRAVALERRSGRTDRRLGHDRRTLRAARKNPRLDPIATFWTVQVLIWVAVVVGVMALS